MRARYCSPKYQNSIELRSKPTLKNVPLFTIGAQTFFDFSFINCVRTSKFSSELRSLRAAGVSCDGGAHSFAYTHPAAIVMQRKLSATAITSGVRTIISFIHRISYEKVSTLAKLISTLLVWEFCRMNPPLVGRNRGY